MIVSEIVFLSTQIWQINPSGHKKTSYWTHTIFSEPRKSLDCLLCHIENSKGNVCPDKIWNYANFVGKFVQLIPLSFSSSVFVGPKNLENWDPLSVFNVLN